MRYPTRWQRMQQQTGWPFGVGITAFLLISAFLAIGVTLGEAFDMWITGGQP